MHRGPVVDERPGRETGCDVVHDAHVVEVAEPERRACLSSVQTRRDSELSRQESVRSGRIDHELSGDREWPLVSSPAQSSSGVVEHRGSQLGTVAIVDACGNRFAYKMMVDVRTKPMA